MSLESSPSGRARPTLSRRATTVLLASIRVLRVGWDALGIALLLLVLINVGAARLVRLKSEAVGDGLMSRPAYQAAASPISGPEKQVLARDIAATHDTPFEGQTLTWQPFVYWRSRPHDGIAIRVDSRGVRRTTDRASGLPGKRWKIFCFGGSTMWGSGVGDQVTIPSLLEQGLADRRIAAEVTNFGQGGYVLSQELITFALELRDGHVPDLVLFYDGYNDIGSGLVNDEPGSAADEFERVEQYDLLHRPTLGSWLTHYLSRIPLTRLMAPSPEQSLAARILARTQKIPTEQLAKGVLDRYIMTLRVIQALADGAGIDTAFFLQPLPALRQRPSEQEIPFAQSGAAGFYRAIYQGIAETKRTLGSKDRAMERLTVLSDAFDKKEWDGKTAFFDDCHTAGPGNREIALRMLDVVVPILNTRFQRLSASPNKDQ